MTNRVDIDVFAHDKASGVLGNIAKGIAQGFGQQMFGMVAKGFAAIPSLLSDAIDSTKDWGQTLDDIGDVLGTTSEQSAGLASMFKTIGGDSGQLTQAMAIMSKGLEDAKGELGPTGKALKSLGIDFRDAKGKIKPATQLFQEIADKLGPMPEGIEKISAMMDIFGKSGKEMGDALNAAANGGMDAYIKQAKEMGLAIDSDQVIKTKMSMETLNLALQGIMVQVGSKLLPVVQSGIAWVQANLIPALRTIWTWLQTNIPIAIQTVSGFWSNTLYPAIQSVGDWISANLVPIFQSVWTWLQTNIPGAIQVASDFWNNILYPALQTIWGFIQTYLVPIFQDVYTWINDNLPKAIQALSDFWNNILQPAIEGVWSFIQTYFVPVLQTLADIVGGALTLAWEGIKAVIGGVADIFNGIRDAIKGALEAWDKFWNSGAATYNYKDTYGKAGATVATAPPPPQARASGGYVEAGQKYIVGENGPEPFVPSTDGYVYPNKYMGRFGGTTINVYGWQGDPHSLAAEIERQKKINELLR